MGFLSRLLGRGDGAPSAQASERVASVAADELGEPDDPIDPGSDQQAVVAWLPMSDPELTNEREQMRVFRLADRVMRALETSRAGTIESNDLDRGFYRLYVYGPDADALVGIVAPILRDDAPAGSYLVKRRGPKGTSEERVDLGAPAG